MHKVAERVGINANRLGNLAQAVALFIEAFDVDPNLWRPLRGDLAHQLFVHEGTHVLQGGVSPGSIIETLDVFKGGAPGLRSCLK